MKTSFSSKDEYFDTKYVPPSQFSSTALSLMPSSAMTPTLSMTSSSSLLSSSSSASSSLLSTKALTGSRMALPATWSPTLCLQLFVGWAPVPRNVWRTRAWVWMFLCLGFIISGVESASNVSAITQSFPSLPLESDRPVVPDNIVFSSRITTADNAIESSSKPNTSINPISSKGHNEQIFFSTAMMYTNLSSSFSSMSTDTLRVQPVDSTVDAFSLSKSNTIVLQSSMQTKTGHISVTPSEIAINADSEHWSGSLGSISHSIQIESSSIQQTNSYQDKTKVISTGSILQSHSSSEGRGESLSILQTFSVESVTENVSGSIHTGGSQSVSESTRQYQQTQLGSSSNQLFPSASIESRPGLFPTAPIASSSLQHSTGSAGDEQVQNTITSVPVLSSSSRSESDVSRFQFLSKSFTPSIIESHTSSNAVFMSDTVSLLYSSRSDGLVIDKHSSSLDISDSQSHILNQPSNVETLSTNSANSKQVSPSLSSSSIFTEAGTSVSFPANLVSRMIPSTESTKSHNMNDENISSANSISSGILDDQINSGITSFDSYSKTKTSPSKSTRFESTASMTSQSVRHSNGDESSSPAQIHSSASRLSTELIQPSSVFTRSAISVSTSPLPASIGEESNNKGTRETESNGRNQTIESNMGKTRTLASIEVSTLASDKHSDQTISTQIRSMSMSETNHQSLGLTHSQKTVSDTLSYSNKPESSLSSEPPTMSSSQILYSEDSYDMENSVITSIVENTLSSHSSGLKGSIEMSTSNTQSPRSTISSDTLDSSRATNYIDSISEESVILPSEVDNTFKTIIQTSPLNSVSRSSTPELELSMVFSMPLISSQGNDIPSENMSKMSSFASGAGINASSSFTRMTDTERVEVSSESTMIIESTSELLASFSQSYQDTANMTGDYRSHTTTQTSGGIFSTGVKDSSSISMASYSSNDNETGQFDSITTDDKAQITSVSIPSEDIRTTLLTPTPFQSDIHEDTTAMFRGSTLTEQTESLSTDSQVLANNETVKDIQSTSVIDTHFETYVVQSTLTIAPSTTTQPILNTTETLASNHQVVMPNSTVVFSSFETDSPVTGLTSPTPSILLNTLPNLDSNSTFNSFSEPLSTSTLKRALNGSSSEVEEKSTYSSENPIKSILESISSTSVEKTQSFVYPESSYGSVSSLTSTPELPDNASLTTFTASKDTMFTDTVLSQDVASSMDYKSTTGIVNITKSLNMSDVIPSDIDSTRLISVQPSSDLNSMDDTGSMAAFLSTSQSLLERERTTISSYGQFQSTTYIERNFSSSDYDILESMSVHGSFTPSDTLTAIRNLYSSTLIPPNFQTSIVQQNLSSTPNNLESSLSLNFSTTSNSLETSLNKENVTYTDDALASTSGQHDSKSSSVDLKTTMIMKTTFESSVMGLESTIIHQNFSSNSFNMSTSEVDMISTSHVTTSSTFVDHLQSTLSQQNFSSLLSHIIEPTSVQAESSSKFNDSLETETVQGNLTISASVLGEESSLQINSSSSLDLLQSTIVDQGNTSSVLIFSDTETPSDSMFYSNSTAVLTQISSVPFHINFTSSFEVTHGMNDMSSLDFNSTSFFDLSQTLTPSFEESSSVQVATSFVENNTSLATSLEHTTIISAGFNLTQTITTADYQSTFLTSELPVTMSVSTEANITTDVSQTLSDLPIFSTETGNMNGMTEPKSIPSATITPSTSTPLTNTSTGPSMTSTPAYNSTITETPDNVTKVSPSSVYNETGSQLLTSVISTSTGTLNTTEAYVSPSVESTYEPAFTSTPGSNASVELVRSTMSYSESTFHSSDNSTLTPVLESSSLEYYNTSIVVTSITIDQPLPSTYVDAFEMNSTSPISNSTTIEERSHSPIDASEPTPVISNTTMATPFSSVDISEVSPTLIVYSSTTVDVSEMNQTHIMYDSSMIDASGINPTRITPNSTTNGLDITPTPMMSNSTTSEDISTLSTSPNVEQVSPTTLFPSDSVENQTTVTQSVQITPTIMETPYLQSSLFHSFVSVEHNASSESTTNSTSLAPSDITHTPIPNSLLSLVSSLEPNTSSLSQVISETFLSTSYSDLNSSQLSDSILEKPSQTHSSLPPISTIDLSQSTTNMTQLFQSSSEILPPITPTSTQIASDIARANHTTSLSIDMSSTSNTTIDFESTIPLHTIIVSSAEISPNETFSTISPTTISAMSKTSLAISTAQTNMSTHYSYTTNSTSSEETVLPTQSLTVIITDSPQNSMVTDLISTTETVNYDNITLTSTPTIRPVSSISLSDNSSNLPSDMIIDSTLSPSSLFITMSSESTLETTTAVLSSFTPPPSSLIQTQSIFDSQSVNVSSSSTPLSPTSAFSSSYQEISSHLSDTVETNTSTLDSDIISKSVTAAATTPFPNDTTQATLFVSTMISSPQVTDIPESSSTISELTPHTISTTELPSSEESITVSSTELASPLSAFSSTTSISLASPVLTESLSSSSSSLPPATSSSASPSASSSSPSSSLPSSSSLTPAPSSSSMSSSLSSSLPPASSSSLPTSAPPTGSTLPTIDNSGHITSYWVSVGLLVRNSVDVTTPQFKSQMEQGLANAYAKSSKRQDEIDNGTFESLGKKRKRRAVSAVNDPNVKVEVTSIERDGSTTSVSVNHVVQQDGVLVPADEASKELDLLNDMELAIQLNQVVDKGPTPYINPTTSSDDDDNTAIIAGAVSGAVVALILIVVIIICCCCGGNRCCVKRSSGEFIITDLSEKNQVVPTMAAENPSYYVDDESQGNATMSITSKKGKYTLADNGNETDDTEKTNGRPMPARRPPPGKKSADNDNIERKASPKKKRGKKKMDTDEAMEMRSVYESQIASLQESPIHTQMPPAVSNVDLVITGPPTVEMEEDLLENAEEERRKNKQRLREKRRKEKEHESPIKKPEDDVDVVYESAQKEIDRVLGPRKDALSVERTKKKSKDKKKKKEKSDDSDDNSHQEEPPPAESLEEARVKIHRLLDDAFSLISQSRSSMGNKVHPTSQQSSVDKGSPRSQQSHRSHSSIEQADQDIETPVVEEKKHTPLYVDRSHGQYDRSGLISWSPYRASDDTALISLPNTQTNLNTVAPQRDPIKGTTVFSESLPSSLQPSYYTTLPGEPIVLNTKVVDPNHKPHHNQHHPNHHHHRSGNGDYINVKSDNISATRDLDPHINGQRGYDNGEEFYTPYYGMSSYHELPPSSVVPNSPNGMNNSSHYGDNYSSSDRSDHLNSVNNDNNFNEGLKTHSAPSRGGEEGRGKDFVDVIKDSVQPGASPQPLIHSLREELMNLSRKKGISSSDYNNTSGGRENGMERSSVTSKNDGKPPSGMTSHGQDVYYRNNRNRHMKTDL